MAIAVKWINWSNSIQYHRYALYSVIGSKEEFELLAIESGV